MLARVAEAKESCVVRSYLVCFLLFLLSFVLVDDEDASGMRGSEPGC